MYYFVQRNPNSTRADVAKGLSLSSQSCTARIKELIDEGYLFEPPDIRKRNASGVNAKVLQTTDRPEGGQPLDTVKVEIVLTIDCNGVYGAQAKVVNGKRQSGAVTNIARKRLTMKAPHPDSYKSSMNTGPIAKVNRMETELYADDIIDAEVISEES